MRPYHISELEVTSVQGGKKKDLQIVYFRILAQQKNKSEIRKTIAEA
jgi:hypothetical protein